MLHVEGFCYCIAFIIVNNASGNDLGEKGEYVPGNLLIKSAF